MALAKAEIRAYKFYRLVLLNQLTDAVERLNQCKKGISKCDRTIIYNIGYLTQF